MTSGANPRPDDIAKGIGFILASTAAMAFGDAIVKLVSADLTVWQVFVARSAFAIPCLFALARWQGAHLRPKAATWVFGRSLLLVLTWLAYYASLPVLNLSLAAVAVYTNPIITALLSALLLGERVSGRQWAGVALGFVGVAVILKPGTDAFSWAVLLPLAAAAFYSAAMIMTRGKCQHESPITLAIGLHVSFVATGAQAAVVLALAAVDRTTVASYPFLLDTWPRMAAEDWGLMAFLGLLSAGFFLGVARAYQIAPPQIIGTFDYSYLVWAALWGMVFFSEVPDGMTLTGMVLISAAGLLVAGSGSRKTPSRLAS
ncbi:MAG: DMT family transporter, partial [Rhodobiaceae bacterium]|nr:DMT family transporter [Rhodobiaceae bacterium]